MGLGFITMTHDTKSSSGNTRDFYLEGQVQASSGKTMASVFGDAEGFFAG